MNTILLILLSLVFVAGQFARLQFDNGVSLLGIDIAVGCIAALVFGTALIRQTLPKSRLIKPFLLFVGVAVLSLLVNMTWLTLSEILISSLYLLRFVAYGCLYLFIVSLSKKEINMFVGLLLGVITLVVLVGYVQYVYYPHLGNLFYLGWDEHLYRLFSVYLDPNYTGVLLVLFLFFLVFYLKRHIQEKRLLTVFLAVLICFTIFAIFLTYSRTALVMLVVGGLIYLTLLKMRKLIMGFIALVIILLVVTSNTSIEGLNPFRVVSTQARVISYTVALDIVGKHPVFGVGFNAYRYAQNEYGHRVSGNWLTSHADSGTDNSFLFVLATTGLIGLTVYLYLWHTILKDVWRKVKDGNESAKLFLVSSLSLFVGTFFINALFYPFIMAWMWVLYGLVQNEKS